MPVTELVLKELLPFAKEGLKMQKVAPADISRYLDIVEERCKNHTTGARWALRAFTQLKEEVTNDEAVTIITAATIKNQKNNQPVHTWDLPTANDLEDYRPSRLKVEEFMGTDLITAQKDDIVELAAEIMEWRKIRYMPVENNKGELVGLISGRLLLRHFAKKDPINADRPTTVSDLMIEKPITTSPETTILDAMAKMREHKIGCLPVVKGKELVGIITEMDFLRITQRLMERLEAEYAGKKK
jgi:CBS domain-containing protein